MDGPLPPPPSYWPGHYKRTFRFLRLPLLAPPFLINLIRIWSVVRNWIYVDGGTIKDFSMKGFYITISPRDAQIITKWKLKLKLYSFPAFTAVCPRSLDPLLCEMDKDFLNREYGMCLKYMNFHLSAYLLIGISKFDFRSSSKELNQVFLNSIVYSTLVDLGLNRIFRNYMY